MLATLGNLVGEFASRLHVFQSFLVPRALGFLSSLYFCGTGMKRADARVTAKAVDCAGGHRGVDARRLLRQRDAVRHTAV